MADNQLHVYMDGVRAGAVSITRSGALSFITTIAATCSSVDATGPARTPWQTGAH